MRLLRNCDAVCATPFRTFIFSEQIQITNRSPLNEVCVWKCPLFAQLIAGYSQLLLLSCSQLILTQRWELHAMACAVTACSVTRYMSLHSLSPLANDFQLHSNCLANLIDHFYCLLLSHWLLFFMCFSLICRRPSSERAIYWSTLGPFSAGVVVIFV